MYFEIDSMSQINARGYIDTMYYYYIHVFHCINVKNKHCKLKKPLILIRISLTSTLYASRFLPSPHTFYPPFPSSILSHHKLPPLPHPILTLNLSLTVSVSFLFLSTSHP